MVPKLLVVLLNVPLLTLLVTCPNLTLAALLVILGVLLIGTVCAFSNALPKAAVVPRPVYIFCYTKKKIQKKK